MDFIQKSWSRSGIKKRKFNVIGFQVFERKTYCETKEENFSFIAFERNIVAQKGKQFRNRKITVHWIQMNFHDT